MQGVERVTWGMDRKRMSRNGLINSKLMIFAKKYIQAIVFMLGKYILQITLLNA